MFSLVDINADGIILPMNFDIYLLNKFDVHRSPQKLFVKFWNLVEDISKRVVLFSYFVVIIDE